jgi:exopolysaccharide biosynthesis polyprenyl glycosylphosphotransferase
LTQKNRSIAALKASTTEVSGSLFGPHRVGPIILVADLLSIFLYFNVAARFRTGDFLTVNTWGLYGIGGLILLGLYLADTYEPEEPTVWLKTASRVLVANLFTGVFTSTLIYLLGLWGSGPLYGRGIILGGFALTTVSAVAVRGVIARWASKEAANTRWLVIADGEIADTYRGYLSELFPSSDVAHYSTNTLSGDSIHDSNRFDELQQRPWTGVLVGGDFEFTDETIRTFMEMRLQGTPIYTPPRFYEEFLYKIPPSELEDDWFVFSPGFSLIHKRINLRIKRVIDVVVSALLLLVLSPLMLLVAIAIKLDSRGPVIYSQVRSGLNSEEFEVHKFRSMTTNAEEDGAQWAQDEDPRVTRVGKWLRSLRIDELPQLWNVLKGEMSLIGPRPERPHFDNQLSQKIPYYDLRYLVKPGITGWAQVMHRYGSSEDDAYTKLEYDMYYIKNYSLLLDLAIVMKTIRVVLFGKGR